MKRRDAMRLICDPERAVAPNCGDASALPCLVCVARPAPLNTRPILGRCRSSRRATDATPRMCRSQIQEQRTAVEPPLPTPAPRSAAAAGTLVACVKERRAAWRVRARTRAWRDGVRRRIPAGLGIGCCPGQKCSVTAATTVSRRCPGETGYSTAMPLTPIHATSTYREPASIETPARPSTALRARHGQRDIRRRMPRWSAPSPRRR